MLSLTMLRLQRQQQFPPELRPPLPQRQPTQPFRQLVQTKYRPLFGHVTRLQDPDAELKLQVLPTIRSPTIHLLRPHRIRMFGRRGYLFL